MPSASFPGNGNYRLDLSNAISGLTINATIGVCKLAGSGFWTYNAQWWRIRISGGDQDGTWTYDFRGATPKCLGIATRGRYVGYGTFLVEAWVNMDSGIGQAYTAEWVTIAAPPGAPVPIAGTPDQITTTSMRYRFSGTTDNGSGVLEWQAQYATRPDFSNATTVGSSGTTTATGLLSATTYYWRSRGRNGVGWGAWSATVTGTTLPAGPPGLTAIPGGDGTFSSVQITPPGNSSGVNSFLLEWRLQGGATTRVATGTTYTLTGLTPGGTYEYRALARYGNQDSPWSTWLAVKQTLPVADPNAYFDGSMIGAGSRLFFWEGKPHASRSLAKTRSVQAWTVTAASGAATLSQAAGGFAGKYSARAVVTTTMSGAGLELGLASPGGRANVIGDAPYVSSIYARPSRSQRLAAVVYWLNAAGAVVGTTVGGASVVAPGAFVRLVVYSTAPASAAHGIIRAIDVTGTGWSAWKAGQYLDADAAMISLRSIHDYFDGNTPDTINFTYDWDGASGASSTVRNLLPATAFTLLDPDCAAIPSAPRPPAITNDCIVLVGQWRRFWGSIPAIEVSEWMDVLPTITLQSAGYDASQVRIRFYRNPDALAPEQFDASTWESELILSYMPANATVVIDGISETATAETGGRTGVPADHLLYGTEGGVVSWPVLSCGEAYLVSWDIPLDLPTGNLSLALELTQRM